MAKRKMLQDEISDFTILIDTSEPSRQVKELMEELRKRVIGQERAIQFIGRHLEDYYADLKEVNQPIACLLFAGHSGVGKTLMAEELGRTWINPHAKRPPITRIQCSSFALEHEVAKLTGAPPGYVGHGLTPLLSQRKIDWPDFLARTVKSRAEIKKSAQGDREKEQQALNMLYKESAPYESVILFDEVEKAHRSLWQILLHILGEAELYLSDGTVTDFSNSIIVLTTNIGGRDLITGNIGFQTRQARQAEDKQEAVDQRYMELINNVLKRSIEKIFPPELVGRIRNGIIGFRPLSLGDYEQILELQLREVQSCFDGRNTKRTPIQISFTKEFKDFLLREGASLIYGARVLKSVVKEYVRNLLSAGINTGKLKAGDKILFTIRNGKPRIYAQTRPAALIAFEQTRR